MRLTMVAPSFVMMTSPVAETICGRRGCYKAAGRSAALQCPARTILSMPFGPRLVRTASAMARAAVMLLCLTVLPRVFCSLLSLDTAASAMRESAEGVDDRAERSELQPLLLRARAAGGFGGGAAVGLGDALPRAPPPLCGLGLCAR
eukprot:COSAG04_NODE_4148_length_2268_cov_2.035912_5_plen_146_part_01